MKHQWTFVLATIALGVFATAGVAFAQGKSSGKSKKSDTAEKADDEGESASEEASARSAAAGEGPATKGGMKVLKAKTASGGVEDREPVDVTSSFSKGDEVTVWMAVRNPESSSNVTLVWKAGDAEISKMDLNVGKSWRWRTWGRIKVLHTGDWSVEIQGPDGKTLETVEFSVSES